MDRIAIQSRRQKDYFNHLHYGIRIVKIAAYTATALFNEGYAAILKMDVLKRKIGPQCKQYADSYDARHTKRQERASLSGAKEARAARMMNQIQEQDFFKESEGFLYGPRIADQLYAAASIQKLILFIIENFKCVFLKSTFFKLVGKITRKILN